MSLLNGSQKSATKPLTLMFGAGSSGKTFLEHVRLKKIPVHIDVVVDNYCKEPGVFCGLPYLNINSIDVRKVKCVWISSSFVCEVWQSLIEKGFNNSQIFFDLDLIHKPLMLEKVKCFSDDKNGLQAPESNRLLFFAGPPKAGSTWLYDIIINALDILKINYDSVYPIVFHDNHYVESKQVLDEIQHRPGVFCQKGHFGNPFLRDLLLSYPSLKVFIIWRDPRDTLVSHFHWVQRLGLEKYEDFADFYYNCNGRQILFDHISYRNSWLEVQGSPSCFQIHFEELKQDFQSGLRRIISFAGFGEVDLVKLEASLSLGKLRKKGGSLAEKFYRKSAVKQYESDIEDITILDEIVTFVKTFSVDQGEPWLR